MVSEKDMRRHIKDSFLLLAEENQYKKVNVTSVCKAAHINRSTFYFYFESIETLLDEIEYDYLSQIAFLDCLTTESVVYGQVIRYVEYVRDHRQVFFVLIKNGRLVNAFLKQSMEKSKAFNQHKLQDRFDIDRSNMLSAYTTVGSLALLETWLTFSPDYPAEKVASMICYMAIAGSEKQTR